MKKYNNTLNLLGWIKEQQSMTLLIAGLNLDSMKNKDRMSKHLADFQKEMVEDNKAIYNWTNMSESEQGELMDIFERRITALEEVEGELLSNQESLLNVLLTKPLSDKEKQDIESEYQLVTGILEIISRGLEFYIDCLNS